MRTKKINNLNAKSPVPAYEQDSTFKINHNTYEFNDPLLGDSFNLCVVDAFRNAEDVAINRYSNLVLSEKLTGSDIGVIQTNKKQFRDVFVTSLEYIADDDSTIFLGLSSQGSGGFLYEDILIPQQVPIQLYEVAQNECYFTIELIDEKTCQIYHYDGFNRYYLRFDGEDLDFENPDEDDRDNDEYRFEYIIDKIFKKFSILYNNGDQKVVAYRSGIIKGFDPELTLEQPGSIANIRYNEQTQEEIAVQSLWNSYATGSINQNDLSINASKSYKDIKNNYLLNMQYETLTGDDLALGITALKNQLTQWHDQTRENPFTQDPAVDVRDYNALYTGTNQIGGHDKISIGYESFISKIGIPSGKLVHFHMPQDMYPYKKLNINDSGLTEAGAIPSTSPLWADKVFKKAGGYKTSSNFGNVEGWENGEYLCTWLRYDEASGTCKWVDRYYDVTKASVKYAMEVDAELIDSMVSQIDDLLSDNEHFIFDKTSDVSFEPGVLYAYYRVGQDDAKKIVDTYPGLIQTDLKDYKSGTGAQLLAEANDENETVYEFNGTSIGTSDAASSINDTADFVLNFELSSSKWSDPMGHMIIGNYLDKGFAVYNKRCVTSTLKIPSLTAAYIINSNGDTISTIENKVYSIHGTETYGEFYTIEEGNPGPIFNTYNVRGELLKSIQLGNDVSIANYSAVLTDESIFVNLRDNELSAAAMEIPLSASPTDTFPIHTFSEAITGTDEYAVTSNDLSYTAAAADYSYGNALADVDGTLYLGHGSAKDVDIYGNTWKTEEGKVYKFDGDETFIAFDSTVGSFHKVKTDIYGNVWALHDNALMKASNDRDVMFLNELSAIDEIPAEHSNNAVNLDFIREFDKGSLKEYCIVFNQTGSKTSIHFFNMDGTFAKTLIIEPEINSSLSAFNDFTNYDRLKLKYASEVNENKLTFIHRQQNPADPQGAIEATFNVDISKFPSGKYQHFTYRTITDKGRFELYVNNKQFVVDIPGSLKRLDDTITKPFYIGTAPVAGNVNAQEYMETPTKNIATNFSLKNFKLYHGSLNNFDINFLFRMSRKGEPIVWYVPSGGRQHIETIDHFFTHRAQGFKSNFLEMVNKVPTGFTAEQKEKVLSEAESTLPINKKIHQITWLSSQA
jgi:hypothetical protein